MNYFDSEERLTTLGSQVVQLSLSSGTQRCRTSVSLLQSFSVQDFSLNQLWMETGLRLMIRGIVFFSDGCTGVSRLVASFLNVVGYVSGELLSPDKYSFTSFLRRIAQVFAAFATSKCTVVCLVSSSQTSWNFVNRVVSGEPLAKPPVISLCCQVGRHVMDKFGPGVSQKQAGGLVEALVARLALGISGAS